MRILISVILFLNIIYADNFIAANKSCKATNNLKATKNSGNISVVPAQRYKILDEKPHSVYIQIPYASPSGRWVDKSCFDTDRIPVEIKEHIATKNKVATQFILSLSWHDAFCETHRGKKECKRNMFGNKKHGFVLHGLWPQPKSRAYCGVDKKTVGMDRNKQWSRLPELGLPQKTKQELYDVMPAVASGLEKHEWIKHGTCSGMSKDKYFTKSVNYTKQFNSSALAAFINANRGKRVILKDIRKMADRSFGMQSGERVEMVCSGVLMTEIRLSLGNDGGISLANALKSGTKIKSSCHSGIIDKAGWQ
ncbi:MAG: ribonuclease T2 family protein [Sulfurovaceae bacterium]